MEIAQLALVGGIVSVVVQFIKSSVGTSRTWTIATVAGLSLVAGGFYYQFSSNTAFWESFVQILISANAVYGFILKNFEEA